MIYLFYDRHLRWFSFLFYARVLFYIFPPKYLTFELTAIHQRNCKLIDTAPLYKIFQARNQRFNEVAHFHIFVHNIGSFHENGSRCSGIKKWLKTAFSLCL